MITDLIRALYGWACERLYHEFAWCYDIISWLVSCGRWSAWRRMALNYVNGARVLELGFGTGELLLELSHHASAVHGIDLSPQMQRVTQRKIQRYTQRHTQHLVQDQGNLPVDSSGHPTITLANAQLLPFSDGSFNTIISTFPAPYILEKATLSECARVLGESGRLVVLGMWVTPRRPGFLRYFPVFFGEPGKDEIEQIAHRFRLAGFEPRFEMAPDRWADVSVVIAEPVV